MMVGVFLNLFLTQDFLWMQWWCTNGGPDGSAAKCDPELATVDDVPKATRFLEWWCEGAEGYTKKKTHDVSNK